MTKEDMQTLRILFGQGLTDNEIAEKMCYSPLTIMFYRRELGMKRRRGRFQSLIRRKNVDCNN